MSVIEIKASDIIFIDGQLSYIGQDAESIPTELVVSYGPSVKRLDLSFNCLRSLHGLEGFTNVEELILDNNSLEDDITFPCLPRLHTLMLNKNNLKDLDRLLDEVQRQLKKLSYLSLLGNEACPNQLSCVDKDEEDYNRYRLYVLYRLPNLKFLDSTAVSEAERDKAKQQGRYLKVVKPSSSLVNSTDTSTTDSSANYSPLPSGVREEPDHKATYGKCRYVYYGRHSEGNRFIRNNDL